MIDFHCVAKDLVRSIRGDRSQGQINQKLGTKSNQVYRWESGNSKVLWSDFVKLSTVCKIPIQEILREELGYFGDIADDRMFLSFLINGISTTALSRKVGLSRHKIANYLSGKSKFNVETVLRLIHLLHHSLFTILLRFSKAEDLPTLKVQFHELEKAREHVILFPWTILFLDALTARPGSAAKAAPLQEITNRIGITELQGAETLEALIRHGYVEIQEGVPTPTAKSRIFAGNFHSCVSAKAYWTHRSLKAIEEENIRASKGRFAVFTIPVDEKKRLLLSEAYNRFFRTLKDIELEPGGPSTESYYLEMSLFEAGTPNPLEFAPERAVPKRADESDIFDGSPEKRP